MINIPLIQGNSIQDINTSIIAIKKAQKELESLNALVDNKIKALNLALSGGVGKFIQSISQTGGQIAVEVGELTDTIASGNNQPISSDGLANSNLNPVDTVTSGNTHSVTSNAVAGALKHYPDVTYYTSVQSANLNCNDITDRVCLVTATTDSWASLNYPFRGLMFIITANNEGGDGFQKAISWGLVGTFPEFTRVCKNGVWQSWQNIVLNNDLGDSLGEQRIGTWIDGSPLYKKAIVFNIPQNGDYSIPIDVSNFKNLVKWSGNFFQGGYQAPQWIMHIPYTYIDPLNPSDIINIYVYFDPNTLSFSTSFYGLGQYSSGYFNGQGILYIEYTKNN